MAQGFVMPQLDTSRAEEELHVALKAREEGRDVEVVLAVQRASNEFKSALQRADQEFGHLVHEMLRSKP